MKTTYYKYLEDPDFADDLSRIRLIIFVGELPIVFLLDYSFNLS